MKVVLTRVAESDLAQSGDWIARDNPRAAGRWIESALTECESLSAHVERYPRIGFADLRKRPFGDYVIFYRMTDQVEIIRVLHAARDWASLLGDAR
ncbi:type II toxin-antitoxin system RelE/ParE family toxin [Brevundimonas diminuta]|jgi:plasmid stabilization system protein ParE|uniref:type II toxin-antitoxin system RelE/ParE family toxin n=1 Tax=Brevundimonas diminuta TaxID=293 RepID=UPI0035DC2AA3